MFDTLVALGKWNWLILGILLMGVEALVPGVFMFWLGLAALIIGFVIYLTLTPARETATPAAGVVAVEARRPPVR